MKKNLFATSIIITLALLFSGFNCQAASIEDSTVSCPSEVNTAISEDTSAVPLEVREAFWKSLVDSNSSDATVQEDTSSLTLEVIEECFWEELVNKSLSPLSAEDYVIQKVIEFIESQQLNCFCNKTYMFYPVDSRINSDRLFQKLDKIVELYNSVFDIPIHITNKSGSGGNSTVFLIEVDAILFPVSYLGQLATVTSKDAIYWESSEGFGTGKTGSIAKGDTVVVTKVSYLDEDGTILKVEQLDDADASLEIDHSKMFMLHIQCNGEDYGWIYPRTLTLCE